MARAETVQLVDDHLKTASPAGAARRPAFDVTVQDCFDAGEALALWGEAASACVFNHPVWWQAALDCFGPDRRVFAITVRNNDALCAFWLFWEKQLGFRDAFVRVLEPVGSRVSDYLMPLIAPGCDSPGVIAAMIGELETRMSPRTMILWPKADDVAVCDAVGRSVRGRGFLVHRQVRPCPRMALAESYAALEARWSRNHRSQVRRRIKRLGEKGEVALYVARTRKEIGARLPVLFEMHKSNWQARGGGSEFDDAASARFIERLVEDLPAELLHYSEVRAGNTPVSSHLGFLRGGDILWYKPAFDLAFSQYSPGMTHVALLSRWGIENGFEALDFMQGEESYKFSWADETRETVSHAIAGMSGYPVWLWNTRVRKLIVELKT